MLPGTPPSQWQITGDGNPSLQGFTTDISVNHGQTVNFKINDTALAPYEIDIYRMGYYGGCARARWRRSFHRKPRRRSSQPLTTIPQRA
jgi:hypothetical protein